MSVETAADRTALLADYGTTVTKADTSTFTGIFDNDFLAVDLDESEVESSEPTLLQEPLTFPAWRMGIR